MLDHAEEVVVISRDSPAGQAPVEKPLASKASWRRDRDNTVIATGSSQATSGAAGCHPAKACDAKSRAERGGDINSAAAIWTGVICRQTGQCGIVDRAPVGGGGEVRQIGGVGHYSVFS